MDYGYVRNEVASYIYDLDGEIIAMYLQNGEGLNIDQLDKFVYIFFQHLSNYVDIVNGETIENFNIITLPVVKDDRNDLIILLNKSMLGKVKLNFSLGGERESDSNDYYEYPINYYLKMYNNNGKELNFHINKIAEGGLNYIIEELEDIIYKLVAV